MPIFGDALKEYGLGSGEKFKVAEGANRIRVLSEPKMVQSVYQGQPNTKFVCWVIDRSDGQTAKGKFDGGKIKLYYMPKTVLESIVAFEESEDYGFEAAPRPLRPTPFARARSHSLARAA